ncbi:unnamed protein product [Urochloa humidicola]
MTIKGYCSRIKVLSDTLRDVGAPVSNPDLVVSLLSGLNDKFGHCVTTISAARPRMTYLQAQSFLLQEESWMNNRAKKAAATSLLSSAGASSATPAAGSAPRPQLPAPPTTGQPSGGYDGRSRKRKKQDNRPRTDNNQGGPSTGGQPRALPRPPPGPTPGTASSRPGRSRPFPRSSLLPASWVLVLVSSHS